MSPMAGITSRTVETPRLAIHVLERGEGVPVLFVHGNASSSVFWEETMLGLPAGYRAIAPDLRGYGDTERCGSTRPAGRGIGSTTWSACSTGWASTGCTWWATRSAGW